MNKSIRKVAAALAVLFAALFVNMNFVQVVKGNAYRDNPDNLRVLLNEHSSPRGDIVVAGSAIAHSKATPDDDQKYLRVYPNGPLYAPVTGFYSLDAPTSPYLGTQGIEYYENSVLSGDDPKLFSTRLTDLLTGRDPRGGSVELTLDRAAQTTAYAQLNKTVNGSPLRGSVVALDPTTGAILAAVSLPSYDPNKLTSHNSASVRKAYNAYCKPDAKGNCTNSLEPLLNRAFNQLYPPGSIFKTVVAAAALENGVTPSTSLVAPVSYYPETGATGTSPCKTNDTSCVENFEGEECNPSSTTATLAFAYAKSCNTLFSALAVDRGLGSKIAAKAKQFGFDPDSSLSVPLPVVSSTVGSKADLTRNGFLARTAFGQQDVRVTTLQAAMMASAVANEGTLMKPYLVSRELAPNLDELSKTNPTQLDQVLDPSRDHELQQLMEGVVNSAEGTGSSAKITSIPNVVVAGKTGTADTGLKTKNGQDAPPDSWFIGYASESGVPKIAVAVVVENGGNSGDEGNGVTGGANSAPIAQAVMQAYLKANS